ncbi:unnamed protein product, partial [Prorocentrum cordatum]
PLWPDTPSCPPRRRVGGGGPPRRWGGRGRPPAGPPCGMRREAPALLLQQLATLTPLGLTTLLWLRTSGTKQDLPGLSWSDLLLLLAAAGTAGVIYTVKSTASEVLEKAAADPAPRSGSRWRHRWASRAPVRRTWRR